jgi:hypothetical protein
MRKNLLLASASSLSLSYFDTRLKYNSEIYDRGVYLGSGSIKFDTSVNALDINYYFPNGFFYLGAGVYESKAKASYRITDGQETLSDDSIDNSGTRWTFRAGVSPVDGLLLWSEFFQNQEVSDEWNINAKYVFGWGGNAVNIEASYETDIDQDRVFLAADYYFDRSLSLGAMYENYEDADNNFGLRARKYFTDSFALEASYLTSSNYDSYRVGVNLRF